MAGIKQINIAVVDDGINEKHYNTGILLNNIEITRNCEIIQRTSYDPFEVSHGTVCAAIIKKIAPDAVLSSVKILSDETRKGIREQLAIAIDWCVDNEINIINLSAGTIDYRDFDDIQSCVTRAVERGLIIVAACNNRNIYTCPASLEYVIGVKCDKAGVLNENEYLYNTYAPDGIEVTACSTYKLLDYTGKETITSLCNSFSAPTVTAAVYNVMKKANAAGVEIIKQELFKNSNTLQKNTGCMISNQDSKVEIDVPLIILYDIGTGKTAEMAGSLTAMLRDEGYNAVFTCDVRLENYRSPGLIPLKTFCGDDYVTGSSLKTIYCIYDPDIIIACIDAEDSKNFERINCRLGAVPDIALFASFEKLHERNLPKWDCKNIMLHPFYDEANESLENTKCFNIKDENYIPCIYDYMKQLLL